MSSWRTDFRGLGWTPGGWREARGDGPGPGPRGYRKVVRVGPGVRHLNVQDGDKGLGVRTPGPGRARGRKGPGPERPAGRAAGLEAPLTSGRSCPDRRDRDSRQLGCRQGRGGRRHGEAGAVPRARGPPRSEEDPEEHPPPGAARTPRPADRRSQFSSQALETRPRRPASGPPRPPCPDPPSASGSRPPCWPLLRAGSH